MEMRMEVRNFSSFICSSVLIIWALRGSKLFLIHRVGLQSPLSDVWVRHPWVCRWSLPCPKPCWKMKMACADCNKKNNPSDTVMGTFIYSDLNCYVRCMTWQTSVGMVEQVCALMLFWLSIISKWLFCVIYLTADGEQKSVKPTVLTDYGLVYRVCLPSLR